MLQPPTHVLSKHKSLCLVDGCENSRKVPSSNNRLPLTCPAHAGARAVPYLGALSRECQACRTFHELAAFDRDNKTCETRLLRKKLRYRARTLGAELAEPPGPPGEGAERAARTPRTSAEGPDADVVSAGVSTDGADGAPVASSAGRRGGAGGAWRRSPP